jgi:DNA-binding response OmpR family regulator
MQQFAQQAQNRPRIKALVVEDNVDDLNYFCTVLRAQGCDAIACASHDEALLCLQGSSFEFIVLTQGSCTFEGRRVLERAIEIDRHTPVLVLTRCLEMSCYLEAMQLGAVDYLEKPVPPEQIAWLLETHLRRSSAQNPSTSAALIGMQ